MSVVRRLVAVVLVLAACGDASEPPETSPGTSPPPAVTSATEPTPEAPTTTEDGVGSPNYRPE